MTEKQPQAEYGPETPGYARLNELIRQGKIPPPAPQEKPRKVKPKSHGEDKPQP